MPTTAVRPYERPSGTKEVDPSHGLDPARLEAWLARQLAGFAGPLEVRQFRGGQSNPTYLLATPGGRFVLRRKPPGRLLRSAHAIEREFRALRALDGTGVPVPRAHVLCEDTEVIGSSFYVMDHVEGRVIGDMLLPGFSRAERSALYDSMNETLARLHSLDPAALGLADYGRPGSYFARQVHRWTEQYRASAGEPIPEMERLAEWLPAHLPQHESTALVHGDFGFGNLMLHPSEPRVVAVLDWELSTLGDPLADLTYHLAHRRLPTAPFSEVPEAELAALGIPSEAEYVAAWCRRTGRADVPRLEFYLAFHFFRTAAVLAGIAGRVRTGTAAGEGAAELAETARPIAELALHFAAKLGA
jgi:aminoglycoside phosphotransferase (APT) family kinase protein